MAEEDKLIFEYSEAESLQEEISEENKVFNPMLRRHMDENMRITMHNEILENA